MLLVTSGSNFNKGDTILGSVSRARVLVLQTFTNRTDSILSLWLTGRHQFSYSAASWLLSFGYIDWLDVSRAVPSAVVQLIRRFSTTSRNLHRLCLFFCRSEANDSLIQSSNEATTCQESQRTADQREEAQDKSTKEAETSEIMTKAVKLTVLKVWRKKGNLVTLKVIFNNIKAKQGSCKNYR